MPVCAESLSAPASGRSLLSVSASPATRLRESSVTHSFTVLAQQARAAGLQARAPWFYGLVFAGLLVALGGTVSGFILLGDSWLQLLMAGALGVILTQFAFLGHEASHRQILASGPANDRIGRLLATLFVGISYQWWMDKHNRHHANPNNVGKDPDMARDTISFLEEDAAVQRGFSRWLTRRQGYLFFPLLLLEGVNLHLNSIRSLVVRRRAGRGFELTHDRDPVRRLPALLFWLMPIGHGASPSSVSSSPCSVCTWARRSPRTTRACRSSPVTPSSTSSPSRSGPHATSPAAGASACSWAA